jgi:hypothetical protein
MQFFMMLHKLFEKGCIKILTCNLPKLKLLSVLCLKIPWCVLSSFYFNKNIIKYV